MRPPRFQLRRLLRLGSLAGAGYLWLLAGCAGGMVRPRSTQGPFGPVAPPGPGGAQGAFFVPLLAGLALGLALGFIAARAWPAWRRRWAARRAGGPPATGLPGDLTRLRAALDILEGLLLDWRGRGRPAGGDNGADDETTRSGPGQGKPGGRVPRLP